MLNRQMTIKGYRLAHLKIRQTADRPFVRYGKHHLVSAIGVETLCLPTLTTLRDKDELTVTGLSSSRSSTTLTRKKKSVFPG
jgi:hypothetical protein